MGTALAVSAASASTTTTATASSAATLSSVTALTVRWPVAIGISLRGARALSAVPDIVGNESVVRSRTAACVGTKLLAAGFLPSYVLAHAILPTL
jgi:hypothetical protein